MIGAAVAKKRPPTPDKCQCCEAVNPQFPDDISPFCVGCAERRRCPAQSPLSGYEPVYMPRLYNAKKYTQHNHNCFAYAFDIMDLPTMEECNGNDKEDCKVPFHQPGYASGKRRFDESGEKRCFDLFSRLKSDMPAIEIARNGRPITFTDKPAKGYSKIALVIDPKQDYHFYRQDSNGFWSHKPGGTPVTHKDSAGRLIYNPVLANRDNRDDADDKDGLNYNVFCGFMCVPRTLPNRAKRGGGKTRRSTSLGRGIAAPLSGTRGGMIVSKAMIPWLRKTQRLVGGMNNNTNTMNGKPNNGYSGNAEELSVPAPKRRKTVRKHKPFTVKTVETALRRVLSEIDNPSFKKKNVSNAIAKKYNGFIESLPSKYMASLKGKSRIYSGTLFGYIRDHYENSEAVRQIFREANFLPSHGASGPQNSDRMLNYLAKRNARNRATARAAARAAPRNINNPYARPVKGTRVGAVTAKLRAARDLDNIIKTTGATKTQVDTAVKNIAASGMPKENRLEALKARLIAEHKDRLLLNSLGHTLSAVPLGTKQANWRISNSQAAALAAAPAPAPGTGFYMKPATFIAPGGIGGPHPHYTASVAPSSRTSSNNEDWGGEGNDNNSLIDDIDNIMKALGI